MSIRLERCIENSPTHTKCCALTSPPQRNLPQRSASKRSKNEGIDSRTQQNSFLDVFPIRAYIFAIKFHSNDSQRCRQSAQSLKQSSGTTYQ